MIRSTMAVLFGIFVPDVLMNTLNSELCLHHLLPEQMTFGTSLSFISSESLRQEYFKAQVRSSVSDTYTTNVTSFVKAPILIVLPCTCTVRLYPVIYNTNGAIVQIKKDQPKGKRIIQYFAVLVTLPHKYVQHRAQAPATASLPAQQAEPVSRQLSS